MIIQIEGERLTVKQIKLNETTTPAGGDKAFSANLIVLKRTLRKNPKIVFIDFRDNKMGDVSVQQLLLILERFSNISAINLSDNNISRESAPAISKFLGTHKGLVLLDLRWNLLRNTGISTIASTCLEELCRNKSGLQIRCDYNGFDEEKIKRMLLAKNSLINFSRFPMFLPEAEEISSPKNIAPETLSSPENSLSTQPVNTGRGGSFSSITIFFSKFFKTAHEYERLQPLSDFSSLPEHQSYGTFGEIPRGTL